MSVSDTGKDEVLEWILRNQLGRRNLNDFQRNRIALKYEEVIRERMKEKMLKAASDGGKNYSPTEGRKGMVKRTEPSGRYSRTRARGAQLPRCRNLHLGGATHIHAGEAGWRSGSAEIC